MNVIFSEAYYNNLSIGEEIIGEDTNGVKKKRMYVEGEYSTADTQNRNGRSYPKPILQREVDSLRRLIDEDGGILGDLEHPQRMVNETVEDYVRRASKRSFDRAACNIIHLEMKGNSVIGKAIILHDDGSHGSKAASIANSGFKLGISSRAVGGKSIPSANGVAIVPEDIRFVTFDLVESPSNYNSRLSVMIQEEVEMFEKMKDVENDIEKQSLSNRVTLFKYLEEKMNSIRNK
jgi:hypothetical protein